VFVDSTRARGRPFLDMEPPKDLLRQYLTDSVIAADRSVSAVAEYERTGTPSRGGGTPGGFSERAGSVARSGVGSGASASPKSPRAGRGTSVASGALPPSAKPRGSETSGVRWRGPSSESGYSYPETAVTSRVAESISESELNMFMSKITMLENEMVREKQRGERLSAELQKLEGQSQAGQSSPKMGARAGSRAGSNAATAGLTSKAAHQKVAAKAIAQERSTGGGRVASARPASSSGWGYATLAQTGAASLRPVRPKPTR